MLSPRFARKRWSRCLLIMLQNYRYTCLLYPLTCKLKYGLRRTTEEICKMTKDCGTAYMQCFLINKNHNIIWKSV